MAAVSDDDEVGGEVASLLEDQAGSPAAQEERFNADIEVGGLELALGLGEGDGMGAHAGVPIPIELRQVRGLGREVDPEAGIARHDAHDPDRRASRPRHRRDQVARHVRGARTVDREQDSHDEPPSDALIVAPARRWAT